MRQTVKEKFKSDKAKPHQANKQASHGKGGHHRHQRHDAEVERHTLDSDDSYWRETLDKTLETLAVNIAVMLLVLVDVFNVLVLELLVYNDEPQPFTTTIQLIVLALFVLELTLRQIAQASRFWKNAWNIFDTIVIYASCVMLVVPLLINEGTTEEEELGELDTAKSATTPMRIVSRVAVAIRVVRVLLNMRKVSELKGDVETKIRTAVSQNKRRYQKLGFNLDLTYITDRVIAMSAPALGGHKTYRNDCHVVSRFLSLRHYASFFIFNLCDTVTSSDGVIGNYHPQMFFHQVKRIPFEDHGPVMAPSQKLCAYRECGSLVD